MPRNIEIEIQVQVEKTKKLLAFLKKNGEFLGEKHQIDQYFIPAHRDFTKTKPINEWLRLRDSSGRFFINYKNWHREKDGASHYCDEYESVIKSLEQLENIFKALNMKSLVTVDKLRKIWLYKDFEVAIDSVKELGDFVEIEYKGIDRKKKPSEITKKLCRVSTPIAFSRGYCAGKILTSYNDGSGTTFIKIPTCECRTKENTPNHCMVSLIRLCSFGTPLLFRCPTSHQNGGIYLGTKSALNCSTIES